MKIKTTFAPVDQEKKEELIKDLQGILEEDDLEDFKVYPKPYDTFGYNELDNVILIAEVTIEGTGMIKSIEPNCSVDQVDWPSYEDEEDMSIDPVYIPFKLLSPKTPFEVKGSRTFTVILRAEGNIWDSCKDLPEWIWNEGKFEFMLSMNIDTDKGKFQGYEDYARAVIDF